MKTFNDEIFVVGFDEEIAAIEKSMRRAWKRDRSNIWPSHLDSPRFIPGDVYGIAIEPGMIHDTYYVVNANTIASHFVLGEN